MTDRTRTRPVAGHAPHGHGAAGPHHFLTGHTGLSRSPSAGPDGPHAASRPSATFRLRSHDTSAARLRAVPRKEL